MLTTSRGAGRSRPQAGLPRRGWLMPLAALVALCLLAACGSSSSSSGGAASTSSSSTGTTTSASSGSKAAEAAIAPLAGHPSAFPVTAALRKLPKGATVAYMDCGTPVCALIWQLVQVAGKTMGIRLTHILAGSTATTVSAAFDSVLNAKPAAVIVASIPIQLWSNKARALRRAKIVMVTGGITAPSSDGIAASFIGQAVNERDGGLLADYVAANFGAKANVVVYQVPELPFTAVIAASLRSELGKVCAGCSYRTVDIPAATLGNTAPSLVVSDLQSHPSTTVAVFGADEIEIGLGPQLRQAGVTVKTLGYNPTPANLAQIKSGGETAGLAADIPVVSWMLVDAAARGITGQPLTGEEAAGYSDEQFLTAKDITFNPADGWTGYPDFPQKFSQLWGVK